MYLVLTLLVWQWSAQSIPLAMIGTAVVLWFAFWITAWLQYYPIVYRLIDTSTLLVPEPSSPSFVGEDCEFRTADGLALRGTYIRGTAVERRGVILFGHELKGDRWNATPYVTPLVEAGFDVLTFDFRNHGVSDASPGTVLLPWINDRDVADVRAAIAYLKRRPDADPQGIGVLGISRGGGAVLCASVGEPYVRCLFTDGAYPSRTMHYLYLRRYLDIYIPRHWHWLTDRIPRWFYERFFLSPARRSWGRKNNYPFVDVEAAATRVRRPVLMVHGGLDSMIPVAAAQALQRKIAGPSKLWVCENAKHNGALAAEPEQYRRRLLKFFRLHLAPRRREARVAVTA